MVIALVTEPAHALPRPLPMSRIAVLVGGAVGITAALFGHFFSEASVPGQAAVAVALHEPLPPLKNGKIAPGLQAPPPGIVAAPLIPLSNARAPSCQVLLGDAFVEKVDLAGALEQTQLGNREIIKGNLEVAEHAFCSAALWDAKNMERWLNLSRLFLFRRDAAQAATSAEKALALQPDNPRALYAAGDAWAMQGLLEQARGAFLKAEKLPPLDSTKFKQLVYRDLQEADLMLSSLDIASAERIYRRVVAFAPDQPAASAGIATCLKQLGEPEQAKAWAERAQTLREL